MNYSTYNSSKIGNTTGDDPFVYQCYGIFGEVIRNNNYYYWSQIVHVFLNCLGVISSVLANSSILYMHVVYVSETTQ